MLAEMYAKEPSKPFDMSSLNLTKGIRNFLCDWLYVDSLVVSYAPNKEFPSTSVWSLYLGGWVVEFDSELSSYRPRTPTHKVHYRIIQELFDKGFLVARPELKAPHKRFVLFTWSKSVIENRREILKKCILDEDHLVTNRILGSISGLYGVKTKYHSASTTFEITKQDGTNIPKGHSPRTYVLVNKLGEPVSKLNSMTVNEWEEALYTTAKRAGTLNKPSPLSEGVSSHLSELKRNT